MMNQTTQFGFSALPRASRSALQWRLLLLWAVLLLIPTAVLALPMWQLLSASLDKTVHAARLAQELDMTAIADLLSGHSKVAAAMSNAGIVALILTLLISPLLSGVAVTAARAGETPRMRELIEGGLREYPRMLRMLVWALVPLGIAFAAGGAALEAADDYAADAILGSRADLAGMLAAALLALLFVIAHATLDAGRAALAIDRRRTSAVKAWWSGCKMLARRPVATLGVYLVISLAGLALAAALSVGRINLPNVGIAGFIGALVLTQVIVVTIAWMRSARLFAMVDLARTLRGQES